MYQLAGSGLEGASAAVPCTALHGMWSLRSCMRMHALDPQIADRLGVCRLCLVVSVGVMYLHHTTYADVIALPAAVIRHWPSWVALALLPCKCCCCALVHCTMSGEHWLGVFCCSGAAAQGLLLAGAAPMPAGRSAPTTGRPSSLRKLK